MKKTSILIVDDHALIRASLSLIINGHPEYEVVGTAKNGKKAVEFVSKNSPNIVLMDITMPEMDGIEAARIISSINPLSKVIGLSMHSEIGFITKMMEAGASWYLNKDCAPSQLFMIIDRVMAGEIYDFNPQ